MKDIEQLSLEELDELTHATGDKIIDVLEEAFGEDGRFDPRLCTYTLISVLTTFAFMTKLSLKDLNKAIQYSYEDRLQQFSN